MQNSEPNINRTLIAIPMLLVGGTERQTLNLAQALVAAGCRTTICCYYEYDESIVREGRSIGADVILLKLKRSDGLWHLIKTLITLFKRIQPDRIHVQYVAPGLAPIIAAKLAGLKTIFATVHQPGRTYGWRAHLLLRLGASLCTAFFCVSRSVEESWFGSSEIFDDVDIHHGRRHFTLYNGVDTVRLGRLAQDNLKTLNASLGIAAANRLVGVVGRLREEKGQGNLLEAMVKVIEVSPDTLLLVVGGGPDRTELRGKADSLGIGDHILWLGEKDHAEVLQLYGIMDVVAIPSLFEGFSLAALEAMAARKALVASAVDGLNEAVEHGLSGFLVPPGDSKAMAGRLLELLSDPEKAQAMGEAGRQRVLGHFSMERFASSTLAVYRHFS